MDEIEKRLRESTDACIKGFEAWIKANKSLESREGLMEAMHDVRKVVARLEIEIAISERDRLGSRPIPIPPHRSQKKRGGEGEDADFNGNEDSEGDDAGFQHGGGEQSQPRRHHQGGRNRRPMHRSGGGNGNGNGNSDNA